MVTVSSNTVSSSSTVASNSSDNFSNAWTFIIENGNVGKRTIVDPLLDTKERARVRAMSEFLQNSYSLRRCNFTTYKTYIALNSCVEVEGLPFLVKGKSVTISKASITTNISGVRYE